MADHQSRKDTPTRDPHPALLPMRRFALTVSLVLVTLLTGVVLLIHAQPYNDSRAMALLQSDAGCTAPCFMGVVPGQTTLDEIDALFRRHPWVGSYRLNHGMAWGTGLLVWEWANPPAALIDTSRTGSAWVEDSVVDWLMIPTRLTFGEMWLTLDAPARGLTQPTALFPPLAFHTATFDHVQAQLALACPIHLDHLWRTPVDVLYGRGPALEQETYQLPLFGTCG